MRSTLSFSLPAPSACNRTDGEWPGGSPPSAPHPLSSRDLMKTIPSRAERFPVAIAATAQPPMRHRRIHADQERPPRTSTSPQLKALDRSPGVPAHVPISQHLGAHLRPEQRGGPEGGLLSRRRGLRSGGCRNPGRAGESPGTRREEEEEAGSAAAAPEQFLWQPQSPDLFIPFNKNPQ